jgi:hypothetical protein
VTHSSQRNTITSIMYTVVTSMLNPIAWGKRMWREPWRDSSEELLLVLDGSVIWE